MRAVFRRVGELLKGDAQNEDLILELATPKSSVEHLFEETKKIDSGIFHKTEHSEIEAGTAETI